MLADGVSEFESLDSKTADQLQEYLKNLKGDKKVDIDKYRRDDHKLTLFLLARDGQPRYLLGTRRWDQMPYFSMFDFRSLSATSSVGDRKLLNILFEEAFKRMHADSLFTFFYATRARSLPSKALEVNGALAPLRGLPVFDCYDLTIDAVVPRDVVPKFHYQKSLLSLETRRADYWIKRGTLKMEYLAEFLLRSESR